MNYETGIITTVLGFIAGYLVSVNISNYSRARKWSDSHSGSDFEFYEERIRSEDKGDRLSSFNSRVGKLGRSLAGKIHERRK